jgi:hypothetical protein
LHNRSITSPALSSMRARGPASARLPPSNFHDFLSGDDADRGSFSDDDAPIIGRALALDGDGGGAYPALTRPLVSAYTPGLPAKQHSPAAAGGNGGGGGIRALRSGLRRLTSTGGRSEAREFLRAAGSAKAPQVPRMPLPPLPSMESENSVDSGADGDMTPPATMSMMRTGDA